MKRKRERSKEKTPRIAVVGITNDTLTSLGGLSLFVRYLITEKIVKKAGKIILKVTSATWNSLKFNVLWEKSGLPPHLFWA